jgi:hypothetical protein
MESGIFCYFEKFFRKNILCFEKSFIPLPAETKTPKGYEYK